MTPDVLGLERELPMPASPCDLCGFPLAWVDDWPAAGEPSAVLMRNALEGRP